MPTPATPGRPGPPAKPGPSAPPPPAGTPAEPKRTLQSAIVGAVRSSVTASKLEKRPYLKYAFSNPYNVSLFLAN